jgi:hypothetical protein
VVMSGDENDLARHTSNWRHAVRVASRHMIWVGYETFNQQLSNAKLKQDRDGKPWSSFSLRHTYIGIGNPQLCGVFDSGLAPVLQEIWSSTPFWRPGLARHATNCMAGPGKTFQTLPGDCGSFTIKQCFCCATEAFFQIVCYLMHVGNHLLHFLAVVLSMRFSETRCSR